MTMRMRLLCPHVIFAVAVLSALSPDAGRAGVVNPDISVVGQPFIRTTDDPADPDRERLQLNVGETEFVFDAYLNPYARGFFTVALAEEGIELEEGFFSLLRGLPGGLAMKGGQYRVGFGKLNPAHYGQQHIMSRRSANSVPTIELFLAFLHITSRSETWSFNPAPSVNALPLGHSTQISLGSRQGTAADRAASIWRSHA